MDLTTVTLLGFAALTLVVAGLFLLIWELATNRRRADKPRAELLPHAKLHRDLDDESSPRDQMDHSFGRLIIDSGLSMSAEAAFLLMVLVGASAGAAVFLATDNELAGLAVTPLGMFIPLVYYFYARSRRLSRIHEQLPAALATMSRAVRAGESVEAALKLTGETSEEPIGAELRRSAGHLAMGLSMPATMRSLTDRIRIHELKILSSALVVQRSSGGNLSTTLERVIALIRDRQNFHRQFRAGTAGARLAALLVLFALPAYLLFMVFYGNEYVNFFFRDATGLALFAGGLGLMLVGLLWILSLLRVDY